MSYSISLAKYPMIINYLVDEDGDVVREFGTSQNATGISEYDKRGMELFFLENVEKDIRNLKEEIIAQRESLGKPLGVVRRGDIVGTVTEKDIEDYKNYLELEHDYEDGTYMG